MRIVGRVTLVGLLFAFFACAKPSNKDTTTPADTGGTPGASGTPGTSGDISAQITSVTGVSDQGLISGTVTVTAQVSGDVGSVQVSVGSTVVCTVKSSPYSCAVDTTSVPDGAVMVTVSVTDSHGNSVSQSFSVVIDNMPPVVDLLVPSQSGYTNANPIEVTVDATDAGSGVASVEILRNDASVVTLTQPPFVFSDTGVAMDGPVTYKAVVTDAVGHSSTQSVSIVVDRTPPTVMAQTPSGIQNGSSPFLRYSLTLSEPIGSASLATVQLCEGLMPSSCVALSTHTFSSSADANLANDSIVAFNSSELTHGVVYAFSATGLTDRAGNTVIETPGSTSWAYMANVNSEVRQCVKFTTAAGDSQCLHDVVTLPSGTLDTATITVTLDPSLSIASIGSCSTSHGISCATGASANEVQLNTGHDSAWSVGQTTSLQIDATLASGDGIRVGLFVQVAASLAQSRTGGPGTWVLDRLPGSNVGPSPIITVLPEASVDTNTLSNSNFAFVDGASASHAARVFSLSQQGFIIVAPSGPLPAGAYTLHSVGTVKDIFGTALPDLSLALNVVADAAPPHLLSTNPANGETGVDSMRPWELRFDEPVDQQALFANGLGAFELYGHEQLAIPVLGLQPASVSSAPDSTPVIRGNPQAITPGHGMRLDLLGARDVVGNVGPTASISVTVATPAQAGPWADQLSINQVSTAPSGQIFDVLMQVNDEVDCPGALQARWQLVGPSGSTNVLQDYTPLTCNQQVDTQITLTSGGQPAVDGVQHLQLLIKDADNFVTTYDRFPLAIGTAPGTTPPGAVPAGSLPSGFTGTIGSAARAGIEIAAFQAYGDSVDTSCGATPAQIAQGVIFPGAFTDGTTFSHSLASESLPGTAQAIYYRTVIGAVQLGGNGATVSFSAGPTQCFAYTVAPPSAPSLSISGSLGHILLSWSESGVASNYDIYRGTDASTQTLLASAVTGNQYDDAKSSPADDGKLYYYNVVANGPGGASAHSAVLASTHGTRVLGATGDYTTLPSGSPYVFEGTQVFNGGNVSVTASTYVVDNAVIDVEQGYFLSTSAVFKVLASKTAPATITSHHTGSVLTDSEGVRLYLGDGTTIQNTRILNVVGGSPAMSVYGTASITDTYITGNSSSGTSYANFYGSTGQVTQCSWDHVVLTFPQPVGMSFDHNRVRNSYYALDFANVASFGAGSITANDMNGAAPVYLYGTTANNIVLDGNFWNGGTGSPPLPSVLQGGATGALPTFNSPLPNAPSGAGPSW